MAAQHPPNHHLLLLFLKNKSTEIGPGCSFLGKIEFQTREFQSEMGRVKGQNHSDTDEGSISASRASTTCLKIFKIQSEKNQETQEQDVEGPVNLRRGRERQHQCCNR